MGLFTTDQSKAKKRSQQYRDLIRQEAKIGGTVFGPIPKGVRREFFMLDPRTWVWHEEWTDKQGARHVQTTRYDVRPDGVVKCQNDGPYRKLSPTESWNLLSAAEKYVDTLSKTDLNAKNPRKLAF